jgi:CHASE3 domain sensor protein
MGGCKTSHSRAADNRNQMSNESKSTNEDRFARQDQQSYGGWSSAFTIAVIVVVLCIVVLVYYLMS